MNDLGAIVLAGGKSSRMGQAKAWLPFGDGEVMLTRTVRVLAAVAAPIVVVAAPSQELPVLPSDVLVLRDDVAGEGPLSGLVTGLSALAAHCLYAFATATDAPFLSLAVVRLLREACANHDFAVPFVEGRHHPLSAVYATRLAEAAAALFATGARRPIALFELGQTRIVTAAELAVVDPELLSLANMNTPADYQAALAREAHTRRAPTSPT